MERLREGDTERERSGHLSPPALARLATVLEISLSVVGSRKCISSFFLSGLGVVVAPILLLLHHCSLFLSGLPTALQIVFIEMFSQLNL